MFFFPGWWAGEDIFDSWRVWITAHFNRIGPIIRYINAYDICINEAGFWSGFSQRPANKERIRQLLIISLLSYSHKNCSSNFVFIARRKNKDWVIRFGLLCFLSPIHLFPRILSFWDIKVRLYENILICSSEGFWLILDSNIWILFNNW